MLLLTANQLFAQTNQIQVVDSLPCDASVKLERSFCPNCTAWNDLFSPDFSGKIPVEYHFSVFNADSVEIFSSNDLEIGWKGPLKDQEQETQNYSWSLFYRYEKNGPSYHCNGQVVLIQ